MNVPIGPSTLSPKIGRNVLEINPGSSLRNCAYAKANATTPYIAHAWNPQWKNVDLKASV